MATHDSQTVNITIPKALLKRVDALAKRDYTSRSDIIRQALLDKVRPPRKQPTSDEELDEWGDPVSENWQTVVDFREINPNGVPTKDVIRAMKKLIAED